MLQAQNQQLEEQKTQQDIANTAGVAKVGADAANVLSNTQIGGGQSALQQLLGG